MVCIPQGVGGVGVGFGDLSNTLAYHLGDLRFKPWPLCGKVGSCLPIPCSLQCRILTS